MLVPPLRSVRAIVHLCGFHRSCLLVPIFASMGADLAPCRCRSSPVRVSPLRSARAIIHAREIHRSAVQVPIFPRAGSTAAIYEGHPPPLGVP